MEIFTRRFPIIRRADLALLLKLSHGLQLWLYRMTSRSCGLNPDGRPHARYFHSHGRLSPPQPLTKSRRSLDFIASATPIAAGTPVRQGGEWSGAAQASFR